MNRPSAETVAFVGALTYDCRWLSPLLDEHLADLDGQVLPHLYIADVQRWAEVETLAGRTSASSNLVRVLAAVEHAFAAERDNEIGELISVSFLEHFPRPGAPGSELRSLVGPTCAAQLQVIG